MRLLPVLSMIALNVCVGFGSPITGSKTMTSDDAATSGSAMFPLRKHVDLPDAGFDMYQSVPSTYWTIALQLGSQPLQLVLDTNLAATILLDGGNENYDPKLSPFYREMKRSTCGWKMPSLPYIDNSDYWQTGGHAGVDVKGGWATDRVVIAGEKSETRPDVSLVAPFIQAQLGQHEISEKLVAGGALGLGAELDGATSTIQRVLGGFDKKEVTVWLGATTNGTDSTEGTITFGGRDTFHCEADSVHSSGDWMVQLTHINVGPTPLASTYDADVVVGAKISLSTPFLEAPLNKYREIVDTLRYFANISDSDMPGIVFVDCADVSALPALNFSMGFDYSVPPEDYTIAVEHDPRNRCVVLIKQASLRPGSFDPSWTLGLPFLPKGCISYDYENAVVSVSKLAKQ